jgi:hypothetical protein
VPHSPWSRYRFSVQPDEPQKATLLHIMHVEQQNPSDRTGDLASRLVGSKHQRQRIARSIDELKKLIEEKLGGDLHIHKTL